MSKTLPVWIECLIKTQLLTALECLSACLVYKYVNVPCHLADFLQVKKKSKRMLVTSNGHNTFSASLKSSKISRAAANLSWPRASSRNALSSSRRCAKRNLNLWQDIVAPNTGLKSPPQSSYHTYLKINFILICIVWSEGSTLILPSGSGSKFISDPDLAAYKGTVSRD